MNEIFSQPAAISRHFERFKCTKTHLPRRISIGELISLLISFNYLRLPVKILIFFFSRCVRYFSDPAHEA